ncbi:MAG: DUF1015 family protein [Lachnospiraceae bacterium]|nr:DUF1015 family protein [Lachnospiraceae bacterium]
MAEIRPFNAVRPDKEYARLVAALPYDVYSSKEAREKVSGDNYSFLRIDRAETQLPPEVKFNEDIVYEKAKELYDAMKADKIFITDPDRCYYIYSLVMEGRRQTGIVAASSVDDYMNNVIKKHENTREDKELDRIRHVDTLSAQTGPIFLAYRKNDDINKVVLRILNEDEALYSFTADDGVLHEVYKVTAKEDIDTIYNGFKATDSIYIADGHHRAASAVKVSLKRREAMGEYTGEEEFNYFLSVLFPDEELKIMDYNRTVKDLNGLDSETFMDEVSKVFNVEKSDMFNPDKKGVIGMYLEGSWYRLTVKEELRNNTNPVTAMDVSYLQDKLLDPVLGIKDPRTDSRIDFIGGIRGLKELKRRADGDMKVSFAMYPTSIEELFDVADAGLLMPPKSTWFEPKLRSGIFVHEI